MTVCTTPVRDLHLSSSPRDRDLGPSWWMTNTLGPVQEFVGPGVKGIDILLLIFILNGGPDDTSNLLTCLHIEHHRGLDRDVQSHDKSDYYFDRIAPTHYTYSRLIVFSTRS